MEILKKKKERELSKTKEGVKRRNRGNNLSISILLKNIDNMFLSLEKNFQVFSPKEKRNKAQELINLLIEGILKAERDGWKKEEIRELLSSAWRIHRQSSFIKHIQDWPRGFMADYQAINMIVDKMEESSNETIGGVIGRIALDSLIAEQHRSKIKIQSRVIQEIVSRKSLPKILSLGCGSSRDIEKVQNVLKSSRSELLLIDFDQQALEDSRNRLHLVNGQMETLLINIKKIKNCFNILNQRECNFDLIIAGGLFDYLPDGLVKIIIKKLCNDFLCSGGIFVFTNIDKGNPYKAWMETMANWILIERSEQDVRNLFNNSIKHKVTKDPTGLAWIVFLEKS